MNETLTICCSYSKPLYVLFRSRYLTSKRQSVVLLTTKEKNILQVLIIVI